MPHLAERNICTGCTACASQCIKHCIEMVSDSYGFLYPHIDEKQCIDCKLCEKSCPVMKIKEQNNEQPIVAFAAYSSDAKMRIKSSSGGIFSEIAKNVLQKKGIVYGAAYDSDFKVIHKGIISEEELSGLRGAKYSESELGNIFQDINNDLENGKQVLFSGTPCQVAGLKAFVKKDYDNLFCVDFVCHGVPSPMVWKEYVDFRVREDADGNMPIAINLRAKHTGWSKYQYSNLFQYKNGIEHSCVSSQSLFMKLFVGDYISRPSCENCKFKGYKRVSDVTLGDFWGIWDIVPEMDDNKGTSVVLIQSEKGERLWNEIRAKIRYKEVTIEQVSQYNPSMLTASKANEDREEVLEKIRIGGFETCRELFVEKRLPFFCKVKRKIRRAVRRMLVNGRFTVYF